MLLAGIGDSSRPFGMTYGKSLSEPRIGHISAKCTVIRDCFL